MEHPESSLSEDVTSKDVVLHIIGVIGTASATGCVIAFAGSVVRSFSMEARAGMIAPDEITFNYLRNRPLAPKDEVWDRAEAYWRTLHTDEGAKFDVEVNIRGQNIVPTATWCTSPQDVVPITGSVPDPANFAEQGRKMKREGNTSTPKSQSRAQHSHRYIPYDVIFSIVV